MPQGSLLASLHRPSLSYLSMPQEFSLVVVHHCSLVQLWQTTLVKHKKFCHLQIGASCIAENNKENIHLNVYNSPLRTQRNMHCNKLKSLGMKCQHDNPKSDYLWTFQDKVSSIRAHFIQEDNLFFTLVTNHNLVEKSGSLVIFIPKAVSRNFFPNCIRPSSSVMSAIDLPFVSGRKMQMKITIPMSITKKIRKQKGPRSSQQRKNTHR